MFRDATLHAGRNAERSCSGVRKGNVVRRRQSVLCTDLTFAVSNQRLLRAAGTGDGIAVAHFNAFRPPDEKFRSPARARLLARWNTG